MKVFFSFKFKNKLKDNLNKLNLYNSNKYRKILLILLFYRFLSLFLMELLLSIVFLK